MECNFFIDAKIEFSLKSEKKLVWIQKNIPLTKSFFKLKRNVLTSMILGLNTREFFRVPIDLTNGYFYLKTSLVQWSIFGEHVVFLVLVKFHVKASYLN